MNLSTLATNVISIISVLANCVWFGFFIWVGTGAWETPHVRTPEILIIPVWITLTLIFSWYLWRRSKARSIVENITIAFSPTLFLLIMVAAADLSNYFRHDSEAQVTGFDEFYYLYSELPSIPEMIALLMLLIGVPNLVTFLLIQLQSRSLKK